MQRDIAIWSVIIATWSASALLIRAIVTKPAMWRWAAWTGVLLSCAPLPLLLPATQPLVRGVAAAWCAAIVVRLWDLTVRPPSRRPAPGRFFSFMIGPFALAWPDDRIRTFVPAPPERALRGAVLALVGSAGLILAFASFGPGAAFLLEHVAKATFTFVFMWGLADLLYLAWSAAKLPGRPMLEPFVLARTPAEFWRLYNTPVHEFFRIHAARARRYGISPAATVILVFLASGLLHEYMATAALGSVQGFQVAFFLIQGVAVVVTQRLRPTGWAAVLGIAVTFAFNLLTSVLFFASVSQMMPWYADGPPDWALRGLGAR